MGGQTDRRTPVTISDSQEEREHARVVNGRLWVDVISTVGSSIITEEPNSTIITLTALNTIFDGSPASANSATVDATNYREFLLHYTIDSTGTPTDIQFIVQFFGGSTWCDYRNDMFGQLMYDDVATATAINRSHSGRCVGNTMRVRVVTTGTGVGNTFTVTNAGLQLKN